MRYRDDWDGEFLTDSSLNVLVERYNLPFNIVRNISNECALRNDMGDLEDILQKTSDEWNGDDCDDDYSDCGDFDDGQPSEAQEWYDFDPDC